MSATNTTRTNTNTNTVSPADSAEDNNDPSSVDLQQPIGAAAAAAAAAMPQESFHSLSYAYKTYLRHDKEELNHWDDVCRSFRQYAAFALAQWANHQYRVHALSEEQRKVLPPGLRRDTPEFEQRAQLYKEAAIRNQFTLDNILRHAGQPHSQEFTHAHYHPQQQQHSTDAQMSKVSSVLKSLARDWSSECKEERDMAYQPLLAKVQQFVPIIGTAATAASPPPRICVPGAGVGRLALELAALGYSVQGNEFSLYMLLASDFILNGGIATPSRPLKISPWLLESRNVHHPQDPVRVVQIPDVDPYSLLAHNKIEEEEDGTMSAADAEGEADNGNSNTASSSLADFSMAAGEFVSIYSAPREQGKWDAVVACFFLDTSPSIVEYLQVISGMLKEGGVLINFGPLSWHWSGPAMRPDDGTVQDYHERYSYLDTKYLTSIDMCWEDIQAVLKNIGFEMLQAETGQPAYYTADRRSMMNMDYRCMSFVARKTATAAKTTAMVV